MSGVRNGVQALMKKESDVCLYVHCFEFMCPRGH